MKHFFRILITEAIKPIGFVLALGVGTILSFTRGFAVLSYFLPFVVPYLVGLLTRTSFRFTHRHQEMLLQLPGYRKDPVFIMNCQGHIVGSTGNTRDLFEQHTISHFDDLVNTPGGTSAFEHLMELVERFVESSFFSPITGKWYRVQLRSGNDRSYWLVWMDDVTALANLDQRRQKLREFTQRLQEDLLFRELSLDNDTSLARLILSEGYQAVVLARLEHGDSSGQVQTRATATVYSGKNRSAPFPIPLGVDAPIMASRRLGYAVHDSVKNWKSYLDFCSNYQILPEVASFLGQPMENFANYHSGDVSIIAFNKGNEITQSDLALLEYAADTAVTAFSLLDLARRADRRFIQSITGLCAAAEYSDELTGSHIGRVNEYSAHLARQLGLDEQLCKDIGTVAALHDIGKVAIPHIIKLRRLLTPEERASMEMHTVIGAQIIHRMIESSPEPEPRLELACQIALYHHQHWDGSGYPGLLTESGSLLQPLSHEPRDYAGLRRPRQDEIPLPALIVSLADKYDALRSCRQYKPGYTHEQACALLEKDDRTGKTGNEIFGKQIYRAFLDTNKKFQELYEQSTIREESCGE